MPQYFHMTGISNGILITINHVELGDIIFCPGYFIGNAKNLGFLRIISYVTTTDDKRGSATFYIFYSFSQ